MYVHGAVLALTGKDTQKPKLECNFVRKKDGHDSPVEYLPGKCFTEVLDLNNPWLTRLALKRFLMTLNEVIDLQAKEDGHAGKAIPVILGIDGRKNYPLLDKVVPRLFEACKEVLHEQGKSLDQLLSQISLRWGRFNKSFEGAKGPRELTPDEDAQLILERSRKPFFALMNQKLAAIKSDIASGNPEALRQAKAIAYDIGLNWGKRMKATRNEDNRFVIIFEPHKLINDIPLLNFLSWDPEIKQACRKGHAEGRGTEMQVVIKAINEKHSPPFVDILACYIQDVFQGIPDLQIPEVKQHIASLIELLKVFYSLVGVFRIDKVEYK